MPRGQRAKQFMPFAALNGFEDQIDEVSVVWQKRRETAQEEKEKLNRQLLEVQRRLNDGTAPCVTAEVFIPRGEDGHGEYRLITGTVKKLRLAEKDMLINNRYIQLGRIDAMWLEDDASQSQGEPYEEVYSLK